MSFEIEWCDDKIRYLTKEAARPALLKKRAGNPEVPPRTFRIHRCASCGFFHVRRDSSRGRRGKPAAAAALAEPAGVPPHG